MADIPASYEVSELTKELAPNGAGFYFALEFDGEKYDLDGPYTDEIEAATAATFAIETCVQTMVLKAFNAL